MYKFILIAGLFAALNTDKNLLTGRWESAPEENGKVRTVVFEADNSFKAYVNQQLFTFGNYNFYPDDSVFSIIDNRCHHIPGTYKVQFYSNGDSIRFQPIHDDCEGRRYEIQQAVLGRVE